MQIKEFADFTGVSVRTLHYYDEIGLLMPAFVDKTTGYRFYDEKSFLRMQEILFYRELDFSLKRIEEILSSPNYDKSKALKEQKQLLTLKKERLERLISAIDSAVKGEMVVKNFDTSNYEATRRKYEQEAKEKWGDTAAYKEYERRGKGADATAGLEDIMAEFAAAMKKGFTPDSSESSALAEKLQKYISDNFYTCTKDILKGLGQMYVADERFKNNIDRHAPGTAKFISEAIENFCK